MSGGTTGQADLWIKIAPVVISLVSLVVTAIMAVVIARLNHRNATVMTELKAKADALTRSEERTYSLRASQVTPFLDKLHDSIYLSKSLLVSAESISALPFPTEVRKALLLSNPGLRQLFELNTELPARRASVLLGISGSHINDFTSKANSVLYKSLKLHNNIVECDMSDSSVTALEKQHQEYTTAATDLFIDLLKYLRAPIDVQEAWPTISAKNLGDWIAQVVAASPGSIIPTPNPSWRALWIVRHMHQAFDEAFDQLAKALETGVDGALKVMIERKTPMKLDRLGYVTAIEFCAKDRLDAFLAVLPEIKMQSKPLWIGEAAPDEKSFA